MSKEIKNFKLLNDRQIRFSCTVFRFLFFGLRTLNFPTSTFNLLSFLSWLGISNHPALRAPLKRGIAWRSKTFNFQLLTFNFLLFFCFSAFSLTSSAQQISPILANTQVNPPYSSYLSDYSSPGSTKLQVNLFLKDLTKTNYPCRLRIKIEGFGITIQSKNDFNAPALFLNGGELSVITGADLEPYFNPQNLVFQGLNQTEFTKNGGKLPEGIYRFTVEVIDYYRKSLVSNSALSVVSIFLAYPPIINQPFNLSKVAALDPQNVVFQWTPRSTGSINAAYNIAYKFRLAEIIPADRDPNDAIRTSRPLYETFTDQTVLVYGLTEPNLIPGNSYAVQVQAVEADGKDLFINNGNSEVVKFTYGDKCASPINILAELSGLNSIKVSWNALPLQQAFTIRYRESNNPTAQWFEQEVYTPSYLIQGLRSSTQYEFQIKAQCIYGYGDYSELQTFKVPDEALTQGDFVCGKVEDLPAVEQGDPLPVLVKSMVFFAGKFPVVVTEASGANGNFSGTGTVGVPFLNALSFKVEFKDIRISTALKLTNGKVSFSRQTLEQSIDQVIANIAVKPDASGNVEAISANGLPTIVDAAVNWPGALPTYDAIAKTVKFTASVDGQTPKEITIKLKEGQPPFVFQDKNNETFSVDKNGTVTHLGKIPTSELLAGGSSTSLVINTEKASVKFLAPNQKYGLDTYQKDFGTNSNYAAGYQALTDNGKGKPKYFVSRKSIESHQPDEVQAIITTTDKTILANKLEFKTGSGEKLSSTLKDSIYTINLIGALADNDKEIYAYHPDVATGGANIGKLNISAFNKISKKVILVPVNGAGASINATSIHGALNKIYEQAVVEWDVKIADNFDSKNIDFDHLETANSNIISAYTNGQKALVNAYRENHKLESGTYYVFLVKNLSDGSAGYMVRGGQVGFVALTPAISEGEGAIGRTIAHELGHGAFMLQHTWADPGLKEKSTKNLMDYAGGTELWYSQWKYMRNPDLIFRPFEGDDEGAYLKNSFFVAINGYPIEIKDVDLKSIRVSAKYPSGSISGYTDKQGKVFDAVFEKGAFVGYRYGVGKAATTIKLKPIDKKLIKVQFIEPTIDDCIYKISVGDYIVPSEISGLVASKIEMPARRDTSGTMTSLSCISQNLANDSYTGKKYLDALGENIGKGNDSSLPKPSDGNSLMFDYAQTLSVKEKQKVMEQLKFINENDGIEGRIYITDYLTPIETKQEIQTYINNLKGKEIALWIDFDINKKPNVQLKVSSDIEGAGNPSTLAYIEKLKERAWYQVVDANWQMDFNPLTAVLDGVAGLIGKLSIPERFYNPSAQNYNSLPATIYAVASLGIIGDELSSILTKNNPYTNKFSRTRCDFAFTCGVWNGLVGTLEAIPSGISGLVKISGSIIDVIVDQDGARTKFAATIKSINWTSIGKLSEGIGVEIGKGWDKYTANPCMVAYSGGQAGFVVISLFIGAGEANVAKTFLQVMEKLDIAGQMIGRVMRVGGVLIKPVINATSKSIRFVLSEGIQFAERIKFSLPNNLYCGIPFLKIELRDKLKNLTADEIEKLEKNIAEQLQDPSIPIDADGNKLVELDINGEKTPALVGTEEGLGKAGKEVSELSEELRVLLSKIDDAVEDGVSKNIDDVIKKGEFSIDIIDDVISDIPDISTKKGKKLTWEEVKALFKRGNDFNKKAIRERWDKFNEVTLSNGKRLDGYTPPTDGKLGEIVSRKATDLEKIKYETFENYLKELKAKYPEGIAINAPKYGNDLKGKILEGKHILEIPESNRSFSEIQEYINLAKSEKYNIEIRFRAE
ncbi:fibronectin type III domain-containing protein [Pedobacter fastidiosus]|uniref:Fibronectin type III domain-containing protein n=1 Tax=Pedobacter fastidiosus TaxID=2765361 RepID=A0ABR7KV05_9SPHI|nr:fibronectin type III domain-containing protein [Pedobacter fastidiosus]MBC6111944.1 fibronectin type III domain-containing protein [Pedobacter fastidiosus]